MVPLALVGLGALPPLRKYPHPLQKYPLPLRNPQKGVPTLDAVLKSSGHAVAHRETAAKRYGEGVKSFGTAVKRCEEERKTCDDQLKRFSEAFLNLDAAGLNGVLGLDEIANTR